MREMRVESLQPAILRIELLHALLALGMLLLLLPLQVIEPQALLIGALFMGVNFLLLSYGIKWVLTPFAGKGKIKAGVSLLILKMVLFLGLLSVLLLRIQLEPLSFAIGFSSLLVAIVLERLWAFSSAG
jgi:hypothetical protein